MRSIGDGSSRGTITVALMGGLGNQLYQLATGLEVAGRSSSRLVLDLSWYKQAFRRSRGAFLRPFELGGIVEGIELDWGAERSNAALRQHMRDVVLRRLPYLSGLPGSRHIVESGPTFDARVLGAKPGSRLAGYFASWRYFPNAGDEVRQRIRAGVTHSDWLVSRIGQAARQRPIAIHIRRGDYLKLPYIYGHMSPAYYVRAVDVLRDLGQGGPVWLFSDDPEGALTWLEGSVSVDHIVGPENGVSSLEVMSAMSSASAIVTANSSFSWWAAYLGDATDRPVVVPRPVFSSTSMEEPRDSYLPHWLSVDCRAFH